MHEIINAHAANMSYRHQLAHAESRMAYLPWKAPLSMRLAVKADKWRWSLVDGTTAAARRVIGLSPRFS